MILGLWEAADGSWFKIILMSCGSCLELTSSPSSEGSMASKDTETPRRKKPSVNDN